MYSITGPEISLKKDPKHCWANRLCKRSPAFVIVLLVAWSLIRAVGSQRQAPPISSTQPTPCHTTLVCLLYFKGCCTMLILFLKSMAHTDWFISPWADIPNTKLIWLPRIMHCFLMCTCAISHQRFILWPWNMCKQAP